MTCAVKVFGRLVYSDLPALEDVRKHLSGGELPPSLAVSGTQVEIELSTSAPASLGDDLKRRLRSAAETADDGYVDYGLEEENVVRIHAGGDAERFGPDTPEFRALWHPNAAFLRRAPSIPAQPATADSPEPPRPLDAARLGALLGECLLSAARIDGMRVGGLGDFLLRYIEAHTGQDPSTGVVTAVPASWRFLGYPWGLAEAVSHGRLMTPPTPYPTSATRYCIEFAPWLTRRVGQTEGWVRAALRHLADEFRKTLAEGATELVLPSFCIFRVTVKPGRTATNPQTGARMEVPPRRRLKVEPAPEFQEAVSRL